MNYYSDSNSYYQNEMSMNNNRSPQQQPQQSYYSYENDYSRHHIAVDQGRYNKSRTRRNKNGRVSNNNMDELYYNNHHEESSAYNNSSYSGYYNTNNDRSLIDSNNYNNRRSSYYKNEDDQPSSPYFMTSPDQQYQERVYAVNQNQNGSSRKSRNYNNKQKYNEYPITPEEGNNNTYLYNNNNSYNNEREDAVVDNEIYDMNYNNNNTGAENLTAAFQNKEEYLNNEDNVEEDEEEEEDPTTQMNTMFNAESNMVANNDQYYNNSEAVSVHSPTATLNDIQQQQHISPIQAEQQQQQQQQKKTWFKNVAHVFKKRVKKFTTTGTKRESTITTEGSPLHQNSPAIQFITAKNNELLGDVLDAEQQQDIISQLSSNNNTPNPLSSSFNMSPEKTKITNLDRIWVFRLIDPNQPSEQEDGKPIAWIGFDYENQIKIENHLKELSNLPENERFAIFYDSHIRHQKMPVIVTPNEGKGYYFANEDQTDLITLQVTFIENNHQKVTFVYRV